MLIMSNPGQIFHHASVSSFVKRQWHILPLIQHFVLSVFPIFACFARLQVKMINLPSRASHERLKIFKLFNIYTFNVLIHKTKILMYAQNVLINRFTNKINFHRCAWALLSRRMGSQNVSVGRDKWSENLLTGVWIEVICN